MFRRVYGELGNIGLKRRSVVNNTAISGGGLSAHSRSLGELHSCPGTDLRQRRRFLVNNTPDDLYGNEAYATYSPPRSATISTERFFDCAEQKCCPE